ncbi:MAG: methyltransferase domain-containing protein [Chitinophagales bacterium]|nr:methyltransferase domain-containing protein [Chitinophagales bacterium]
MEPIYNTIGVNYNKTRTADAYIAGRLYALMAPIHEGNYVDIGCGTGNYLKAMTEKGLHMTGVEPSEVMIEKARVNNPGTTFIHAKAEHIPLPDNSFEGGMGTFTVHHWDSIEKGFSEIYRILKPGANFVLLSFTPEQLMHYWLCHYFPVTMKNSSEVVLSIDEMTELFTSCGFTDIQTEKYFVHEGLTDHFLFSNKYKPEQYLIPEIRNGASSFTVYADQPEVDRGLIALEEDIRSGKIQDIIEQYDNDRGDYLFYRISKPL